VRYVVNDERLTGILDGLWNSPNVKIARDGGSFWMRKLMR
jgi:hypothetical protein